MVDKAKVEAAVHSIINAIGEDPERKASVTRHSALPICTPSFLQE